MKFFIAIIISASILLPLESSAADPYEWEKFSRTPDSKKLVSWMKASADLILSQSPKKNINSNKLSIETPPFYGRLGVFVTLIKGKNVRGCYGSFSHSSDNLEKVLIEYLHGALKSDPRYRPIELYEMPDTDIIITIASSPVQVDDINSVDLKKFGVHVTCSDGYRSVFVPAEIKTTSHLKKTIIGNDCTWEIFKTVTLR